MIYVAAVRSLEVWRSGAEGAQDERVLPAGTLLFAHEMFAGLPTGYYILEPVDRSGHTRQVSHLYSDMVRVVPPLEMLARQV